MKYLAISFLSSAFTAAFFFSAHVIAGSPDRISGLPAYSSTGDVGKVPAVQANGSIAWSPVGPTSTTVGDVVAWGTSGGVLSLSDTGIPNANLVLVSRNVIAGTGLLGGGALSGDVTLVSKLATPSATTGNDLCAWSGTGGTSIIDSGIGLANVVQTSRAINAGTGLTVTNSGLLTSDITVSMSTTDNQALTVGGLLTAASGVTISNGTSIIPSIKITGSGGGGISVATGNADGFWIARPASNGVIGDNDRYMFFNTIPGSERVTFTNFPVTISSSVSLGTTSISSLTINGEVAWLNPDGAAINLENGSEWAISDCCTGHKYIRIVQGSPGAVEFQSGLVLLRATGVTASTGQVQGGAAQTADVTQLATVANVNDSMTLPALSADGGKVIHVRNDGANTAQIFPASGDKICMSGSACGATNAATTLATNTALDCAGVALHEWSCR